MFCDPDDAIVELVQQPWYLSALLAVLDFFADLFNLAGLGKRPALADMVLACTPKAVKQPV